MTCTEEGCGGTIDVETQVDLRVGCSTFNTANPCGKCGRLHWPRSGEAVSNREGKRTFLENNQVVLKEPRDCEKARRLSNTLGHGNDIDAESAVWLQKHIRSCEKCRGLPCIT